MKTTKHTPAPWRIHKNIGRKGELGVTADSAPCIICTMGNAEVWPDLATANARLIAAAPALLIELKNTVAAIEKWGKEHPESGGWIGVIHGALKAIAQAEGGAQ